MTIDKLREAVENTPFVPFTMHMSDGRTYRVGHPEVVGLVGLARMIALGVPERRSIAIIDLLHVTSLTFQSDDLNGTSGRRVG